jgi:hypothetical protein
MILFNKVTEYRLMEITGLIRGLTGKSELLGTVVFFVSILGSIGSVGFTILLMSYQDSNIAVAFIPSKTGIGQNKISDHSNTSETKSGFKPGKEMILYLLLSHDKVTTGGDQSMAAYAVDKTTNIVLPNSMILISVLDSHGGVVRHYSGYGNISGSWPTNASQNGIIQVIATASANGYNTSHRQASFIVAPSQFENGEEQIETSSCMRIQPTGAIASRFEEDPNDYHPPLDAIDGDPQSWWSSQGVPTWLQVQLDDDKRLCSIDITWNKGDEREYDFTILSSMNGKKFDSLYSGKSKKTLETEKYQMADQSVRFVKIMVDDSSSEKGWVSIKEVNIMGR